MRRSANIIPQAKQWIGASIFALLLLIRAGELHADWVLRGNAQQSGSYIAITREENNQIGAAWLDTRLNLTNDFDISVIVNLGTRDSNGADGLSVVLHNDPAGSNAVGGGTLGEWIGMNGIYPALSMEFDTWQNGNQGDPACDHIGINVFPASGSGLPNHAGGGPVCTAGNIEDGLDHTVRLVWNSAARNLLVYFDGVQTHSYTGDIAALLGSNLAWFGVAGSTGGSVNLQRFKAVDLSTSTKTVVDLNGGDAEPGDVLRYTVTPAGDRRSRRPKYIAKRRYPRQCHRLHCREHSFRRPGQLCR
jgi:hypothetical protein